MRIRNIAAAAASAVLIAAPLALAAATPASADEVWMQSVGRVSADAACGSSTAEELAAGWSEWGKSWAAWMNGGSGGFTCDRQITWLKGAPPVEEVPASQSVCGYYTVGGKPESVVFASGYSLAANSTPIYLSSNCTLPHATLKNGLDMVYAPVDKTQAEARCLEAFGTGKKATTQYQPGDVWICV